MVLTSAICLSLLQIWKYSQRMAKHDSLKSRGLLCAHLITFLTATILTTISCVLDQLYNFSHKESFERAESYLLGYIYCALTAYVAWFIVHILMIAIFVTYGKPVEDDEKTLMENKLVEIFSDAISKPEDLVQKHERKMECYRGMADLQIREIIQTMRPYTSMMKLSAEQRTSQYSGSIDLE